MGSFIKSNYFSIVIILYFILDRALKNIFVNNPERVYKFWFLEFYLVKNEGGIFGIYLPGGMIIPLIVLVCLFFYILYFIYHHKRNNLITYGLITMFIGGLSNQLDRIKHGFVIDFVDLGFWPVFNLSDMLILFGVFLVLWSLKIWKKS